MQDAGREAQGTHNRGNSSQHPANSQNRPANSQQRPANSSQRAANSAVTQVRATIMLTRGMQQGRQERIPHGRPENLSNLLERRSRGHANGEDLGESPLTQCIVICEWVTAKCTADIVGGICKLTIGGMCLPSVDGTMPAWRLQLLQLLQGCYNCYNCKAKRWIAMAKPIVGMAC